jgi:hypothetical protein
MSINLINYKKNKLIFNEIIGDKYKIKKDTHDKNYLFIYSNNKVIKCKYLLFLTEKHLKKSQNETTALPDSLIIWSDSNPYIDQYTREISSIVRETLLTHKKYILSQNNQLILKSDLQDLVNSLIKNQYNFLDKSAKSINCNWVLTSSQENITEYYMITDIIYY